MSEKPPRRYRSAFVNVKTAERNSLLAKAYILSNNPKKALEHIILAIAQLQSAKETI